MYITSFCFFLCCILEYIGVLRKWFLERTVLLLTDFFMHKSLYSSNFTFLENEAFESVVTSFESALLSSHLLSFIQKRSPAIFWMRTPLCPCFARRIANKICQLSLIFMGMITTKNPIAFDNFLNQNRLERFVASWPTITDSTSGSLAPWTGTGGLCILIRKIMIIIIT